MDERLSIEAVENLVTQFSSALDFYRELVQNSIDAGSSDISVWTEFLPGEQDMGVVALHIDDYGEGMNEAIINDQLTRLFASNKEDDLTKIGKFGIGFVSVFALKPQGVLVHTGRDGESWEVFFHADRSFTKTKIDTAVEGTQITLFLEGDQARYHELVEGTVATLRKWCSHSDTEVSFEDRSPADGIGNGTIAIAEPFGVDGDCSVRVQHPGTEIALAFSANPVYGFYNRGLALAVTNTADDVLGPRASRYGYISVKVKSRYLEHTLSRETLMRDQNYDKTMQRLDEAADGPLRDALATALEASATAETWDLKQVAHYARLLRYLCAEPAECLLKFREHKLLRTVTGGAVSLLEAQRAERRDGRVFVASAPSLLTAALDEQGVPVFVDTGAASDGWRWRAGNMDSGAAALLIAYLAAASARSVVGFVRGKFGADHQAEAASKVVRPEDVLVHASVDDAGAQAAPLVEQAQDLLTRIGAGYREIRPGTLVSDKQAPQLFVVGRSFAPVMALPPSGVYERGFLERPRALVNREHPHFRTLASLHARSPELAAYCLAKSLLLEEDRLLERDLDLMAEATGGRAR